MSRVAGEAGRHDAHQAVPGAAERGHRDLAHSGHQVTSERAEMMLTLSIIQGTRTASEASRGESQDWHRGGVPGDHRQHPRQGELPQRHQPHLPGGW